MSKARQQDISKLRVQSREAMYQVGSEQVSRLCYWASKSAMIPVKPTAYVSLEGSIDIYKRRSRISNRRGHRAEHAYTKISLEHFDFAQCST